MSFVPSADDTIVAISTPPGRGGIGAVRLSGPQAAAIAQSLFRPAASQAQLEPSRALFGAFATAAGEPIDRGYLVIFAPPRTFTGEEVAELWAHGSPPVLRLLVEAAVARGARPATPGEFTLRAFLNGRLDATQAEAVRDLIEARTAYQARVAHEQASGRISAAVDNLKDRLAGALSRLEAAVEFSDEMEAERFLPEGGIVSELRSVRSGMEGLARSYDRGRLVREGGVAVLAGAPNVGKSSLFNRLLEEERAIVTATAGTTRDTLEETLDLRGVPVTLVDTAGLHEAAGPADAEAVRRSRKALDRADVVIAVLDWSRPLQPEERELIAARDARRLVVVLNKVDLPCGVGIDRVLYLRQRHQALEVSAQTGEGLEDLRHRIQEAISPVAALAPDSLFLTSVRQRDLLLQGAAALMRAEQASSRGIGGEYLAVDLKEALDALGEITGEVGSDEIYQRIFSTFCIGK